jgi:hypothetical protein
LSDRPGVISHAALACLGDALVEPVLTATQGRVLGVGRVGAHEQAVGRLPGEDGAPLSPGSPQRLTWARLPPPRRSTCPQLVPEMAPLTQTRMLCLLPPVP